MTQSSLPVQKQHSQLVKNKLRIKLRKKIKLPGKKSHDPISCLICV
jgi:hypothetical protein